ncbi:MAG: DUF4007 family protein [Armatimonadetes bacterium]|jgi:hypothetical protein|nr:DUF4007 family protein [Armatimonadota bacterium]
MDTNTDVAGIPHGRLLPANPSFAGHQTFPLRAGWLKKGIDALNDATAGGRSVFTNERALVTLGVGKNMVGSIRHWLIVTGMAEECPGTRGRQLEPSLLGTSIFGERGVGGWDPYLEDDATLWLLHWQLAGPGSLAFSWVWAFNAFREYEFSKEDMVSSVLAGAAAHVTKVPARATIGRDVECLLRTYVAARDQMMSDDNLDCPLHSLGLIRSSFDKHFRFDVGPKETLPDAVFCYALASFWRWHCPEAMTLSLRDIAYEKGSPGIVFKLDEDAILDYLDRLAKRPEWGFRFEDTAILRQVVRTPHALEDTMTILRSHYEQAGSQGEER